MSEGFATSLKKYTTKNRFDKETILEDLDLDVFNYDDFYEVVFENKDYKICHPTEPEGMIPLAAGTRWLSGSAGWSDNKKTGWDEIDTEATYGPYAQYNDYYVILDKHDPKKKWMFKDGYGDIYVPSYTRYPCATWVAEHGDEKMWRWFLDQKFPYISTNLDKKVGHKMIKDKTIFVYPDDTDKLTWYNKHGSNITKVEFAPGVKVIKAAAFSGLQQVKEIVIPEGVTTINSRAFYNCNVEKVVLPSTLKTIGKSAFNYCRALKEINLPEGITKMGESVFSNDMALEKMPEWPKGLDTIPDYCFSNTAISEIVLPTHVKHIGRGAFDGTDVKTVIIPNSIESIGGYAFEGKTLKYVYIPSSVTHIEQYAFGSIYSWNREQYNPSLVIDCEVAEKPEGWSRDWNCYDRVDKPGYENNYDWSNPDRYEYKRYTVNWGVPAPRQTIKEDLELDTVQFPGVLNEEQCDKLLNLIISLPEMAENDQEHFLEICKDWLLNIWMSDNTPSPKKLEDYTETLSNPDIKHVIRYWAKDRLNNRTNYMISRFTEDGLGYIVGGEYKPETRVAKASDICVSDKFLKDFLGFTDDELANVQNPWKDTEFHEDLDLDVAEGFPVDYQDEHWAVYHPRTTDEFRIMSDGTTWFDEDRYGDNEEDWHFTYYNNPPFYIFENKDTGEKFLYNTRENWSNLKDAEGNTWTSESGKRNLGYHRTAGSMLGLFLSEMPNTLGLSKWAIKKWPQGLAILKSMLKADELIAKEGGSIIYKSPVYERIKNANRWWNTSAEDKMYAEVKSRAKSIRFPRNTHKIEDYAFAEWEGLKSVVIPNTVTEIGKQAFDRCESLSELKMSNKIVKIDDYAFSGDNKLTGTLFIPASCTYIGREAFRGCNFEKIYCEAKEKPEGWDEHWNRKAQLWTRDGQGNGRYEYQDIPVVWGSKGPVQEDLELDTLNTEIDIPENKKGEVAYIIKLRPNRSNQEKRWYLDITPQLDRINHGFMGYVKPLPYALHIGDNSYWVSGKIANKILKQIGSTVTVENHDWFDEE